MVGELRLLFRIVWLPLALVACTSFGAEDAPVTKQGKGAANASDGGGASPEASTPDEKPADAAGADAGVTSPAALACGGATCTTTGCCVTPQGESCTDACTALYFECFGAENCGAGEVCCATGKTASCAKTCAGTVVCAAAAECGPNGVCEPQRCGGTYSFATCTAGTAKAANVLDCSAP